MKLFVSSVIFLIAGSIVNAQNEPESESVDSSTKSFERAKQLIRSIEESLSENLEDVESELEGFTPQGLRAEHDVFHPESGISARYYARPAAYARPVYAKPAAYVAPAPVYAAPAPAYAPPAPVYAKPAAYVPPAPVYAAPAPVYAKPAVYAPPAPLPAYAPPAPLPLPPVVIPMPVPVPMPAPLKNIVIPPITKPLGPTKCGSLGLLKAREAQLEDMLKNTKRSCLMRNVRSAEPKEKSDNELSNPVLLQLIDPTNKVELKSDKRDICANPRTIFRTLSLIKKILSLLLGSDVCPPISSLASYAAKKVDSRDLPKTESVKETAKKE